VKSTIVPGDKSQNAALGGKKKDLKIWPEKELAYCGEPGGGNEETKNKNVHRRIEAR